MTFDIPGTGLGLAEGCPERNALDPLKPKPDVTINDKGVVRCCSNNGDSCITPGGTEEPPGECLFSEYKNAVKICAALNRRLCTSVELAINKCCYTGCEKFNKKHTWHSGEVKGEI